MFGLKGIAYRTFCKTNLQKHVCSRCMSSMKVNRSQRLQRSRSSESDRFGSLSHVALRTRLTYPQTATGARSAAIVRAVIFADIITAGVPPPGWVFAPTR